MLFTYTGVVRVSGLDRQNLVFRFSTSTIVHTVYCIAIASIGIIIHIILNFSFLFFLLSFNWLPLEIKSALWEASPCIQLGRSTRMFSDGKNIIVSCSFETPRLHLFSF